MPITLMTDTNPITEILARLRPSQTELLAWLSPQIDNDMLREIAARLAPGAI